jgi:FKBP-type peptidyl-prolyl cis-trans isomerase (trigger factor)
MADKTGSVDKITSVLARESNGNIQITFSVPFVLIKSAEDDAIAELAKDVEIPGFRKGMAPLAKAVEKIPQNTVVEHSLAHILPKALAEALDEYKLKIAIYPKFELVNAKDGENWQIRATTCELPEIQLGDYKDKVGGALRAGSIIVPGKDKPGAAKTLEEIHNEKEETVIKTLLENVKMQIPQILIEEEANKRLSNLLARLEKLGLALESYLGSIGKKVEELRADYATQAKEAISLDLILTEIARTESLQIADKEIQGALGISKSVDGKSPKNDEDDTQRKRLIESILKRRAALDFLIGLA